MADLKWKLLTRKRASSTQGVPPVRAMPSWQIRFYPSTRSSLQFPQTGAGFKAIRWDSLYSRARRRPRRRLPHRSF